MLSQAVDAIRGGQRDRARDLLTRLLKTEQDNPEYWLWMSSVVDTPKEQIYCLQKVLHLDPQNQMARRGLTIFGVLPPDDVQPVPPLRRSWDVALEEGVQQLTGVHRVLAHPLLRVLTFVLAAVLVIGLILGGIYGTRSVMFHPRLTITPIPWTPTPTPTETATSLPGTPTATSVVTPTPQPLWMALEATYTPVPPYVNTPHPRLEAYRLGIRAYERGDYDKMLIFMQQALQEEPDAVDTAYYVGEAYRLSGDFQEALRYYDLAIERQGEFAPAYLGRAMARLAGNPLAEVIDDLNRAIELDPALGDAYLQRAGYFLERGDYDAALADLEVALEILPTEPRTYRLLAEAQLALGEHKAALENALQAHHRDITSLPTYLVLARAYLLNDMPEKALQTLETYGLYAGGDPVYLALLGGALYAAGEDYEAAMEALNRAIDLDEDLDLAYYYRGLTALALEDPKQAVNDLFVARDLVPERFEYSLWFGVALFADGRREEAYRQINASEVLTKTDRQRAAFYYHQALLAEQLSRHTVARQAWQALLDLPAEAVPRAWRLQAKEYLTPAESPTPTPTPRITVTPTATSTSTPTGTSALSALTPSPPS